MRPAVLALDFRATTDLRWRVFAAVVLACAAVGVAFLFHLKSRYDHELMGARHQFQSLQHDVQAQSVQNPMPSDELAQQLKRADAVLDALYLPWDDLFVTLEKADSKDLGLLGLTPDPRSHSVRISGEAKTVDEVLAYMKRLSQQPLLTQVNLMSYGTVERGGVELVQFVVGARWTSS